MSVPSVSHRMCTTHTNLPNERDNQPRMPQISASQNVIPNERTRTITVYAEAVAFSDELAELRNLIGEKDWSTAHQVCEHLFELYLTRLTLEEKIELITLFEKIIKKGKTVLGTDFYAFLRAAITSDIECIDNHNPDEVLKGYKEAADLGNYSAMYFLGIYYTRIQRYDDAFKQFIVCAEKFPNRLEAIKEVAIYFQQGGDNDESIDLKRAEFYYRRAIDLGCKDSPCNLAGMLESQLVDTDAKRSEVMVLYSLAYSRGSFDAAYNLAVIHQTGWHRTTENGKKICSEQLINYNEAEEFFRLAYAGEKSDVNAAGVAEIIFDNKAKLTQDRWNEMCTLIAQIRANGSDEADALIEKIEASRTPIFQLPDVADELTILATAAVDRLEIIKHLALTHINGKIANK